MKERGKGKDKECCNSPSAYEDTKCCRVDAIITIDDRGQIVLPKDMREKAGVKAGDKFVAISCESNGKVCCISLFKAEDFTNTIKSTLGPIMKEILQ